MKNTDEYIDQKTLFDGYYKEKILPKLQIIEEQRKKYFYLFMSSLIFTIIWGVIYVTGVASDFFGKLEECAINVGLIFCIIVLLLCIPMIGYHRHAKESLLPILANFFGDFEYSYKTVLDHEILYASKIMPKYDEIEFDDGFDGVYENTEISITEYITYKEKIVHNNNVSQYKLKKDKRGLVFCASMNKQFKGQTVVVKDKGIFNTFNKVKGLEVVHLEAPLFEKEYEVYSDSQIEARYILTPVMLRYMEELKHYFSKIEFSFFDDMVFINILTKKNMFECNSFFTSIINKKRIYKSFDELYLLFSIIHTMHLNEERML